MEDAEGSMWFGTLGDGIAIYDGEAWTKHDVSTGALNNNFVRSIVQDDQGRVWAGTDRGVNLLIDGKLWMAYTAGNTPLPSDEVNDILVDRHGSVWIATQGGLAIFEPGDGADPSLLDQARSFYRATKDRLTNDAGEGSTAGDLGDSVAPLGDSLRTTFIR
jgi:ligand-binding sensor domain-containing protein